MIYIYIYIYTYTHRGGERLSARSLQGGDFHGAAIINAYALYNPGDTITGRLIGMVTYCVGVAF